MLVVLLVLLVKTRAARSVAIGRRLQGRAFEAWVVRVVPANVAAAPQLAQAERTQAGAVVSFGAVVLDGDVEDGCSRGRTALAHCREALKSAAIAASPQRAWGPRRAQGTTTPDCSRPRRGFPGRRPSWRPGPVLGVLRHRAQDPDARGREHHGGPCSMAHLESTTIVITALRTHLHIVRHVLRGRNLTDLGLAQDAVRGVGAWLRLMPRRGAHRRSTGCGLSGSPGTCSSSRYRSPASYRSR